MTHDTDPTPAHGTERPTKTTVLDRLLRELEWQRIQINDEIRKLDRERTDGYERMLDLHNRRNRITTDMADIEQLLIDMYPEPTD